MCKICKKASSLNPQQALNLIAEAMLKGKDVDHFEKALDKILGTGVPEVDNDLDSAWEESYHPKP